MCHYIFLSLISTLAGSLFTWQLILYGVDENPVRLRKRPSPHSSHPQTPDGTGSRYGPDGSSSGGMTGNRGGEGLEMPADEDWPDRWGYVYGGEDVVSGSWRYHDSEMLFTCHGSWAVIACAKFWSDFIIRNKVKKSFARFWLWAHKWFLGPLLLTWMNFNPLHAKFLRKNINIYLHFMSFLHTNKTQVVEIPPRVRQGPAYSTQSISWLLMSWRRKDPGHQQPWYWPS